MLVTNVIKVAALAIAASMVLLMGACTSQDADTATPQPTATLQATATFTPLPTATTTATATPQPTATSTPVPIPTATASPTATPQPTATPTPTPTATLIPTPTHTPTPTPTPTATPTKTPIPTPTRVSSTNPNAFPPYPNIYSGNLVIGGKPAPEGTLVFAKVGGYQTRNVESKDGRYEVVVGPPDRSYFGRTITFYILIEEIEAMAPQSGVFREVQLGSPPQYLHNTLDLVYQ